MAVFQCKMCAGNLNVNIGDTICTCDYCGTTQTLPKLDSDQKMRKFERANQHRRNFAFDEAMGIYEDILDDDREDAEVYWSFVLCRYGIEYVEDPVTHKRIPTIRRIQNKPVTEDDDYKEAIENASDDQKNIYQEEAYKIDEILKRYEEISAKEEPYDVFICYKETDFNGDRTYDSIECQKLYDIMTEEGLRVFFSRRTLEDKAGREYEPYIYAALNSAKVMVAFGTKAEYFNAVWVRNEWSRYQHIIRNDHKKLLIPVCNNVREVPKELSLLQIVEMKPGYEQDLIHQIKKIVKREKVAGIEKEKILIQQGKVDVKNMIKLGKNALEDEEWDKANAYFEEVLKSDAENAEAYLGEWLSEYEYRNIEEVSELITKKQEPQYERLEAFIGDISAVNKAVKEYIVYGFLEEESIRKEYAFDRFYNSELSFRKRQKNEILSILSNDKKFSRARLYAEGELKIALEDTVSNIESELDARIREAEEQDEQKVLAKKESYSKFLIDAENRVKALYEDAIKRREEQYAYLISQYKHTGKKKELISLEKEFQALYGFKDSAKYEKKCRRKRARIAFRNVLLVYFFITAIPHAIVLFLLITRVFMPLSEANSYYKKAMELKEQGQYEEAIAELKFIPWGDFRDVDKQIKEIENTINQNKYDEAMRLKNNGNYSEAKSIFSSLGLFEDSVEQVSECTYAINEKQYNDALKLYHEDGDYAGAYRIFSDLGDYSDSAEKALEIASNYPNDIYPIAQKGDIVVFGNYNGNNQWIVLENKDGHLYILCKNVVGTDIYQEINTSTDAWEKTGIRKWLNSTFYETAFNAAEKAMIINRTFTYDDGSQYEDRVWLLNKSGTEEYLPNKADRIAYLQDGTKVEWMLRTGEYAHGPDTVKVDGDFSINFDFWEEKKGVRPALWLDISTLQQ